MQHTITPYILRCFNANFTNENKKFFYDSKKNTHYMPLNSLTSNNNGQNKDLFELLNVYLRQKEAEIDFMKIDDKKVMYKIEKVVIDENTRTIYGYLSKGVWGIPAHIQDAQGQIEPYQMKHTQAPTMRHFFYIYLPQDEAEAICLFHSIGINGIKSIFENEFAKFFQKEIPGINLQYNTIQFVEIYDKWKNAVATKLTIRKFTKVQKDKADQIERTVGQTKQDLVIHIENKRLPLLSFKERGTNANDLIVEFESEGSRVSGEFELDGKKKTLILGNRPSGKCSIVLNEDEVVQEEGVLQHESLLHYCEQLISDLSKRIY